MSDNMSGFDELKRALGNVSDAIATTGLRAGLAAGAFVLEGEAKQLAAVDTGFMRNAITAEEPKITSSGANVDVIAAAEYSAHLEFGTSKQDAQPFMRPALDSNRAKIEKAVAVNIAAAINRVT